ncbi:MAG: transposase, partial [Myxococcales bacterium]|nr:transposase [Myxococcales bacterium]
MLRRPKFVRKDRDRGGKTTVYISDPHDLPVPRGLAGPGMLADTLVRRWQDHTPANRLEDAHAVYDHLYLDGTTVEVNCWAHARRYFFKAMGSDPRRAEAAL